MKGNPKISHLHLRGLIVSAVIGVGVLSLPNALAKSMGTDGWIAIIISGFLMVPILLMYNKIFSLYPGKDFFEIAKATVGTFVSTIFFLILLAYLVVLLGVVSRNLGELIKIFLLQTTPLEFIIFTFILTTSYIAIYEIDVIARAGYFVYPIILTFAGLIVLIALPGADFAGVLPIFQVGFKDILKGVSEATFSFQGIELMIFAIPFVEDKENVVKSGLIGIFIVTIIYLALFIMTLAQFSITQVGNQIYPILTLIKQLDLPGFFLENLDGLIMALWVIVVFATVAPAYFGAGKVLSKIFKTKKHKYFIWGLIPVVYYIAMLPENFIQLIEKLGQLHNILSIFTVVVIPITILIAGTIRKKVER